MKTDKESLGFAETIALMALLVSLTALAIDIMLPALPKIGEELARISHDAILMIEINDSLTFSSSLHARYHCIAN